ncbi:MAG: heavy metal-binding domain-containing protein [Treponema sp.]
MKKIIFLTGVVLFFASCSSIRPFEINRIRTQEPGLTNIEMKDFVVLERVSGSAVVSSVKKSDGSFDGDTHLYGSLDEYDAVYLNLGVGSTSLEPKSPFDAALANAIYQMIEKADGLQADAVIFVRSKTEVRTEHGKQIVTVKVSGTAVKIKK